MSVSLTSEGFSVEQLPVHGQRGRPLVAEWVTQTDGVRVIARREDGALLLAGAQPREDGLLPQCFRLPGGKLAQEETPLEAAISNLYLETGFRAARWSSLCTTEAGDSIRYPVHYFEARSLRFDPDPSAGRQSQAHWFELEEAVEMALDGGIAEELNALQVLRLAAVED